MTKVQQAEAGVAPRHPEITVQLSNEDGNAMVIVGKVRKAMRRAGVSAEELKEFSKEALSGDYQHVLATVFAWVDVA